MGSERLKFHLFEIVSSLGHKHPITMLLQSAQLARSSYYKWKKRIRSNITSADRHIEELIRFIHSVRPFYGYRRITVALGKLGYKVNHKRVYRLMKRLGIQSTIRKKTKYFGKKGSSVFHNILQRDFSCAEAGKKLVTDITFLRVKTGFLYLSAIQDLHNNEIVSYRIAKKNNLSLVLETVEQLSLPSKGKPVLHSDQGFQYTSKQYKCTLESAGIQGSHSRKGNCLDNACIESFFSHLKTEGLAAQSLMSEQEMISKVHEYILFYNTERFQKRLGQLSPVEYRKKLAA